MCTHHFHYIYTTKLLVITDFFLNKVSYLATVNLIACKKSK